MLAGVPGQGGATWSVLQYLLGLRRLGHDVWLVEPVATLEVPSMRFFDAVVAEFRLAGRAALLETGTTDTHGLAYREVRDAAAGADLLINISGLLRDDALRDEIPVQVYLDLDPAFNQIWHDQGVDVGFDGHHRYLTIGRAAGRVPTCGLDWIATNQPVVLDEWLRAETIVHDAFTTVANWRAYGSVEHDGLVYGQKAHSTRALFALPTLTDATFMPALSIHPDEQDDLKALAENRWRLLDPAEVAGTPSSYREFVQGSRAELGIAKAGYVAARCGWFSDRSVCYLASGRPVLAQDTGFTDYLPVGEGLLAFSTLDEARAGVEEIRRDYPRHARAARDLAEAYFDSDIVLTRLLDEVTA
jgi:hypothetical protein